MMHGLRKKKEKKGRKEGGKGRERKKKGLPKEGRKEGERERGRKVFFLKVKPTQCDY
jgi:hypothetical protein